jgi:hypothetical protein
MISPDGERAECCSVLEMGCFYQNEDAYLMVVVCVVIEISN